VIHLQDFHTTIERVRDQLSKKLFHSYLFQNIEAPVVDEDKLLLLVSFLHELGLSKDEIDNYSVTTMLLQIALDTHENVQNSIPEEESSGLKHRQLTVLAGTYYSGLFYQQLAQANDIEMITTLAAGVKEVNEHKISVYRKDADAIDKLMNSVKLVESSLFSRVTDQFGAVVWKDLITNVLFVKRMIQEENRFLQTGSSIVFDGLKKLSFPRNNQELAKISSEQQNYLLSICERYIDFSINIIEAAMKKLPAMEDLTKERLDEILGQNRSITKKTLEEG
jgi:heptaprenyl diphosphate synthase